jgi:hypothetical protein
MKMYRHGDVIIEVANETDFDCGDAIARDAQGRAVLAEGEVTGHAHRIDEPEAFLFQHKKIPHLKLLRVDETVWLRHEEHKPIEVPPGKYTVRIKRQYSPAGWERVAD